MLSWKGQGEKLQNSNCPTSRQGRKSGGRQRKQCNFNSRNTSLKKIRLCLGLVSLLAFIVTGFNHKVCRSLQLGSISPSYPEPSVDLFGRKAVRLKRRCQSCPLGKRCWCCSAFAWGWLFLKMRSCSNLAVLVFWGAEHNSCSLW